VLRARARDPLPGRVSRGPTERGREVAGDTRAGLLQAIKDRRRTIEAYVREKEPVSTRLLTISIVSSAMAAALTAGPAFGGEKFAETVTTGLSLERPSRVWGILCFGAVVVSVTAAVAAQLTKAHDLRSRIGAAEAAGVMLDGLRTRLEFGRMSIQDAAQEYQDIIAGIPFVHEPSDDPTDAARAEEGGSARRRAALMGWKLGIVAVLAAVLLITTLVGYVMGLTDSSAGDRPTGSALTVSGSSAPPSPSPSPSPSGSPSATVQEAVFAGRTEDDRASVAVVIVAGKAAAYLCDGRTLEAWVTGPIADGLLELAGPNGATLTGTLDGDRVSGRITAAGRATPFLAEAADAPAGVYRATIVVEGVEVLFRWVVLPDGSQVGIAGSDGARGEAPTLRLPEGTFTAADGTTHRADRVRP
jgi:hypothetical protein